MIRRRFLMIQAGLLVALARPALAHNGDDSVVGFDEAVAAGSSILIHVTAPWCGTCKIQKPIVAKLLMKPEFKAMKEFNVDFDSQKEALKSFHVQTQSTMIVFKGNKEMGRDVGQTDPAAIEALLRKAL